MRKTLALILTTVLLVVFLVPSVKTLAIEDIYVYMSTPQETVNLGDILEIKIMAERMPHVVSFQSLDVSYDKVQLSYMSAVASTDLPETFTVSASNDSNVGVIAINGKDESVEDYINEHKSNAEDGEEFDEDYEDISFNSSDPVELCTLKFRVVSAAYEKVNFVLSTEMTFTNSLSESIGSYTADYFTIPITTDVSKDSSLDMIKVNGKPIPGFKRDSFDYAYTVDKNTSVIDFECEPGNSFATYEVTGTDLTFGDNTFYIDVTAQDGVTTTRYKIVINRPSQVTEGAAGFLDNKGQLFTFVNIPDDAIIPEGFRKSSININGYDVQCYVTDGMAQVLIYVLDSEGERGFRVYFPDLNKVINYSSTNTIIKKSSIYTVKEIPPDVKVPKGFTEVQFICDSKQYSGYVNAAGVVICYLETEKGVRGFYRYDFDTQSFTKYEMKEDTDALYKGLFNFCLGVAIFEAIAIIVIVYVVRRFRKERVNPRPRRV